MTGMEILEIEMLENDAGAKTIRDYLKALLFAIWHEGEGFSGKRPFGNSGWEYDLYYALEECDDVSEDADMNELINLAIEAL